MEQTLDQWVKQAEEYNGKHQAACIEIERLKRQNAELLSMCEWARDLFATGNIPLGQRQQFGEKVRVVIASATEASN